MAEGNNKRRRLDEIGGGDDEKRSPFLLQIPRPQRSSSLPTAVWTHSIRYLNVKEFLRMRCTSQQLNVASRVPVQPSTDPDMAALRERILLLVQYMSGANRPHLAELYRLRIHIHGTRLMMPLVCPTNWHQFTVTPRVTMAWHFVDSSKLEGVYQRQVHIERHRPVVSVDGAFSEIPPIMCYACAIRLLSVTEYASTEPQNVVACNAIKARCKEIEAKNLLQCGRCARFDDSAKILTLSDSPMLYSTCFLSQEVRTIVYSPMEFKNHLSSRYCDICKAELLEILSRKLDMERDKVRTRIALCSTK